MPSTAKPEASSPAPRPFVHLRVHSQYSLEDGLGTPAELAERARTMGMPALAITDWHNLFGLVKFVRAAHKQGIKPLVGADLRLHDPADESTAPVFTLLVQNRTGYLNLCRLISRSFIEGRVRGQPRIRHEWLESCNEGLIALLGWQSPLGHPLAHGHEAQAEAALAFWTEHFADRLYLELQRTGRPGEQWCEPGLLALAQKYGIPVVATNDVRFPEPGQFLAHEARVCIHRGQRLDDKHRKSDFVDQQYLKSPAEMAERFADLPVALENTVDLACRLNLDLELGQYRLPEFPVPDGESAEAFLRRKAFEGLDRRLEQHGPAPGQQREDYLRRIESELDVIVRMGFAGYFLIVADFIAWARNHGVPVGPGRGSGAGSLVAWALGITDPDPLRFGLLFERFLNPERVSMPDFDIDFCVVGRDRVIDYVAERYGRDRVSQIITYGTLAAKAAVRDCGRVLGHPYGKVDEIAKLIPTQLDITLSKALEQEPQLKQRYENEEEVRALLDLAMQLEGVARNAGKHAGGVVIAPSPLTDFTPLYTDPRTGAIVTQFDKNDVEAIGLVKFDFLGLRNLTIIDWALESVNRERRKQGLDTLTPERIALDDPETYRLLQKAHTTAVFQLESRGMKDLLRRLAPDCFDDIVAAVALFRPGPLDAGMVDDYVERKHGRAPVRYPHPLTEEILKPTYGVILYQEQVMQIAQQVAGFTLGAADLLRRAMGKKDRDLMARQRAIFIEGAATRGLSEREAAGLFDLIETFAGYGFNKSHSVAYALVACQTAWLKAHYPAEFMAAVLSSEVDKTDKIATLLEDCKAMGLEVLPPDLNASDWRFEVEDGAIRYGLGAIKGVGEAAVAALLECRKRLGKFESLEQLLCETDLSRITRRTMETLICAGALDSVHPNRAALLASLPEAWSKAEAVHADRAAGQTSLFAMEAAPAPARARRSTVPGTAAWSSRERLRAEKQALGLYFSGHPMDEVREELEGLVTCRIGDVADRIANSGGRRNGNGNGNGRQRNNGQSMTLAGIVVAMRHRARTGSFLTMDDGSGRLEVAVFERLRAECGELPGVDEVIVVSGKVEHDDFSGGCRMVAEQILGLEAARAHYAGALQLVLKAGGGHETIQHALHELLGPFRPGTVPVIVDCKTRKASVRLELGVDWRIRPCDELLAAARNCEWIESARLLYRREAAPDQASEALQGTA